MLTHCSCLQVRVLWLEWVQTIFAEYNSPVRTLQYLGKVTPPSPSSA